MLKGHNYNSLFNNLGNQKFKNISFDNEKTITMKKCDDGNYQALVKMNNFLLLTYRVGSKKCLILLKNALIN